MLVFATGVLALGLPRVHPEFGYRVLIGDDHPAVRSLDGFIERFGGGLPIQIGWECGEGLPCGDVFDAESLSMAAAIVDTLRSSAGVSTVLGPPNAPLLVAAPAAESDRKPDREPDPEPDPEPRGFAVRRFIEHGARAGDADALAQLAVDDPLWQELLVSRDRTAAIVVVQPVDSSAETSRRVSAAVLRAVAPHRARGHRFHLTGDPIQNGIVGRDLADSTSRLVPFTILVIVAILYALSRSLRATAIALATLGVALVWTFGLLGWIGWPQDGILEVLAPLILVVGVCDSVHLLSQHAELSAAAARGADVETEETGAADSDRILEAARRVAGPCAITTATTAAAFLSFTTSDLATFHRFGSIAAFGTAACLVLTFSLLPLLMQWLPDHRPRSVATTRAWVVAIEAILGASERRAVPILVASAAVLVFCGAGWWLHLRVDHEWTESLGESSQVVQSWRFMEQRIGRSDTLEVEVVLPTGTPLESPDSLRRLRAFAERLGRLENLRSPRSIVDVIERVNQLLHDDDPTHRDIPDTATANAEILELIGFDDPGLIAQWVSFDRSRVRVSVGAPEQAFSTRERVVAGLRRIAREELPPDWQVIPTGRVAMQHAWIQDVQTTQLRSFPTALGLVFVLVAGFLRSARLGLAALVPTGLPIVVTLGAMGWSGMTLDVGRAMIAAILIGIGVDDSVHILDDYRKRRRAGSPPRTSIRAAVLHTGRAVVTTSLALALGFLTLMASAWQSIASFGFLSAVAILGALVASLLVLPALVFAFSDAPGAPRETAEAAGPGGWRACLGVLLPVVAMLAGSVLLASRDPRVWSAPCWLLPKGHVVALPGSGLCPLQLLDEIRWVADARGARIPVSTGDGIREALAGVGPVATIGLIRRGEPVTAFLPLERNTPERRVKQLAAAGGVASLLLALPVRLLARRRFRGALPFGVFVASIATVVIPAIAGQQSRASDLAAIVALATGPAALAHLGMVFPSESRMVRVAPGLQLLPYAASAVLAAVAIVALDHSPLLWPSFVYLLLALHVGGCVVLVAACAFAPREAVRTARAREAAVRGATAARVANSLMHDLGKDLGWMRGLAKRLVRQSPRDTSLGRDMSEVDALAEDLVRRMRCFVDETNAQRHDPPGVVRLDELLDRCANQLEGDHGSGCLEANRDPTWRLIRCPELLYDMLLEGCQDALSQADTATPLHVVVRQSGDPGLRLLLVDRAGAVKCSLAVPAEGSG